MFASFPPDGAAYNECVAMWDLPERSNEADALKDVWADAKSNYLKACEKYKSGDKKISVSIPAEKVNSTGFLLNGIDFFFKKGTSIGLDLMFNVSDGKLALSQATYKFSQPVLGAANLHLNLSISQMVGGILGLLDEEDVIGIVEKVTVEKYNKKKSGSIDKPVMIGFDRLTIMPSDKPSDHRLLLSLTSDKYYKKQGWGVFSFGSNDKDCTAANSKATPSVFLGDGFGGEGSEGECRSKEIGPRFGRPITKWLLKMDRWNKLYDEYLKQDDDAGVAYVSLMNAVLGSGVSGKGGSWKELEKEENLLGSGFMIWQKNRK